MTEKEILDRASRAESLINDPLLSSAFENTRLYLLRQFETTPLSETEKMHEIRLMLELLGAVRGSLDTFIKSGKMVQVNIETTKRRVV